MCPLTTKSRLYRWTMIGKLLKLEKLWDPTPLLKTLTKRLTNTDELLIILV